MVVVRVIDGSFDFDLHVWTFRVSLQTDCPFDYENMNTHKILINMLAIFQNVSIEKNKLTTVWRTKYRTPVFKQHLYHKITNSLKYVIL